MAFTDINSEDRLVQKTFADHLKNELGWESIYAWNNEVFGTPHPSPGASRHPLPVGEGRGEGVACDLGRADTREVVLTRDLRAALERLNPQLPTTAITEAVEKMTRHDFTRTLLQHNRDFYQFIRDGVPVSYKDELGQLRRIRARVIDFENRSGPDGTPNNRFLAVRELKITGLRTPGYNRRADLVCFVNGLPLVFVELKAVYKNIRAGFDGNLRDYMDEHVIAHAFHHNAFLIVSNGHRARYGSITSQWGHFAEWKRNDESDKGSVEAEVLLNGMLDHDSLLDIVENFILFDSSKPGATRKVVARNHQVLGVNQAVESVRAQEELRLRFPPDQRLTYRTVDWPLLKAAETPIENLSTHALKMRIEADQALSLRQLDLVESAHPDLGKLGVFWHTQGSGKSYSMAFFAEKVRRKISARFTFLLMTDRNDLDSQIYRTFVGCSVVDDKTPRAATGEDLKELLQENHRYIFSLIHKFNLDVDPRQPYSLRDDIIVISDEAHRTQAGKLARNMRLALPNAAFIGFTGTPLFKHDELTKRIFGSYVSRYDFKRSEEDGATVKLVYENRGEKLGITRLDLNDRIADAIALADLDPDQESLLEKLLGKDYEVITADDRLDKVAEDFVEHCSTRWESGKSMLVCIDKITCARMHQRILPRWRAKLETVKALIPQKEAELAAANEDGQRDAATKELAWLKGQTKWLEETIVEIIISEGQGEVADFKKWGFDIIPHRALMKRGFETSDGKRVDVESAFKDPEHPFRVAVVCAMWLTGFDVECLSTLYVDKPMKAHTLMQAIARANRVYPGKDFGLIVDYNGMLKSLREALAQYALGDDNGGEEEVIAPIQAAQPGDDQMDSKLYDLSKIDLEKLRDEFSKKVKRKASALEDIRQLLEKKLAQMLAQNPLRMDYYKKYCEIIADYNHDKDRVTIEETFARLADLVSGLDAESHRAAEEGLSEEEYAMFQLLQKENISKADRERVKLASRSLYDALCRLLAQRARWTKKSKPRQRSRSLFSTRYLPFYRSLLFRITNGRPSPNKFINTSGSKTAPVFFPLRHEQPFQ